MEDRIDVDELRREALDEFTVGGGRTLVLTMGRDGFWALEPSVCALIAGRGKNKRRKELEEHKFSIIVVDGARVEDVRDGSDLTKYIHQHGDTMAGVVLSGHGKAQRGRLFCIPLDTRIGGTEIWCTVARHFGACKWLDDDEYCTNPYVHIDTVSGGDDELTQICREYSTPEPG